MPPDFLEKIRAVLDGGEAYEDKQAHAPVDQLVEAILSLGLTKGDFDSNGWKWDWWQHFYLGSQLYVLSGSGYYGGLRFSHELEEG